MQFFRGRLGLVVCLAFGLALSGCLNKSVVGKWTITLWNTPLTMVLHDGRAQLTGTYKDAPLTVTGTYEQKEAAFTLNVSDVKVKHGNPFTSEMLNNEIQSVVTPKTFSGTLNMDNPDDFVLTVDNYGQETKIHLLRQK